MTEWKWNGARWWKFDIHTHTPVSDDYGRGTNQAALKAWTPKEWLLDYMRVGIDCIAITDHNSGAWIDLLKQARDDLKVEKHPDYRLVQLFPGVEISVNGGIHLLAILGCEKTTSDIDTLLGAVGFTGTKGSSDAVTSKSFVEVVDAIVSLGGIVIPAHVDEHNGLFKQTGTTLQQALDCDDIFCVELLAANSKKPQLYIDSKLNRAELVGSDAHQPLGYTGGNCPGSRFTWIKMGSPSIQGLRLALLDGSLSVLRSDEAMGDPNDHAGMAIESIDISQARYMGRPDPFTVELNPWLNAVIGGRGTGKSTMVEFVRLGFRREHELPDALKAEFEKYGQVYSSREGSGLLTNDASIKLVYRKNGTRFRIQWCQDGLLDPIQEEIGQEWKRAEGDIRQRFPVQMFSQKQIFQLAKTPLALLKIIDDSPEVNFLYWKEQWMIEETRYLSLSAKAREIEAGMTEESRLRGELDDAKRKLSIFEQAGHADVLKEFQQRRRQHQAVEAWEKSWDETGARLRQLAGDILPDFLEESAFNIKSPEDKQLCEDASVTRDLLDGVRRGLEIIASMADRVFSEWGNRKDGSAWKNKVERSLQTYNSLQQKLSQAGAGDPATYGELVQHRQTIEQRLKDLEDRKKQVIDLKTQADTCLGRLLDIRRKITESRKIFLDKVLSENQYVRIQVIPYGAKETVEAEFRSLLQREDGRFEKDIGEPDGEGLLGGIYGKGFSPEDIEKSITVMKKHIRQIALNQHDPLEIADQRFAKHIEKLKPESLDRIDLWFPEDSLDIQYSTTGNRQSFRPIQEGSPGQKTAALLAFLLSYGEEPLILDQPEDDLDNHLIYDLIVMQLREIKRRRQIIVVTHNANIVVNGDAELVVAFAVKSGQTKIECAGSLQDRKVRNTICSVMEGGRKAFEQRYRRIALEGRHV